MKILMLSSTFPYPPSRGGTQVRTFNLLQYLSQRHEVILGTVRSPDVTDAQIDTLRQQVTELAVFPNPQAPPQPPLGKGGLRLDPEPDGDFLPPPLPPPLNKGGTEGELSKIIGKFHRFGRFLLSGYTSERTLKLLPSNAELGRRIGNSRQMRCCHLRTQR